jgi:hypothetical protein
MFTVCGVMLPPVFVSLVLGLLVSVLSDQEVSVIGLFRSHVELTTAAASSRSNRFPGVFGEEICCSLEADSRSITRDDGSC